MVACEGDTVLISWKKLGRDVGMSFRAVCRMNWPVGIKQLEWLGVRGA